MSSAGATYMTYSTLFSDVQKYLERGQSGTTDPTVYEQIPRLINAAERKIIQLLKLQGTIEVLNDPQGLTPGLSVIPKPDRWRETVSISYVDGDGVGNQRVTIYPRSYEYCRTYWPDESVQDATNKPKFYADYNYKNWLIVPTSPGTYPVEIICYCQPPLLSATNQRNFFTDYTPNMLLYGVLLEATPFIKNDERISTWQAFYELEISSLTNQDLQKILDRASERSRP